MTIEDEGRTTAIGLFNYGVSYLRSAKALREFKVRATHKDAPILFLYYHAVELFLKAHLRLRGVTLTRLKNLGHHVGRLARNCNREGLNLSDRELEVCKLIEVDYFRSRYIKTGLFRRAHDLQIDTTADRICFAVGAALKAKGKIVRI